NHQDAHYASALFRYEKEFAVKFREITNMIFLDDKHRCKVGEPGFPVAAIERGKKVVVSKDTTFTVADHDFTKTGIIPSVVMICDIPESINGDFYVGKVRIGLKDPIFQPSSPLRHATE
ncbi:15632_t:CDS:1, partial [Rhizophagus irregularis]